MDYDHQYVVHDERRRVVSDGGIHMNQAVASQNSLDFTSSSLN